MADGYGNIVNNAWRCWCAAWVVSETDTTATIRVEARQQTVNGWTLVGWASGSVNCDGQSASGNSASQTIPTNGYAVRYSRDFTVSKTAGARNVGCSASVSWNGTGPGTSSASCNVAIGGISYKAPNAPSNLSIARVDDTAANLTWKNNPDNNGSKPYQQIIVDRRSLTGGGSWGAWGMIASLGGTATNYRATGLKANSRYQFRILARNQGGDSAHVETAIISTTPAAPRSVTAVKTSASAVTVTADVSNSSPSWVTFRRSTDGGTTWESLAITASTGIVPSNGKAVYTDRNAPAGTVQYRCFTRRVIIGDTKSDDLSLSLSSADPTDSNTVTTITPPLAPTIVDPPSGAVRAYPADVRVQWRANHPDGSAQTSAQVEVTYPTGGTWTGTATTNDYYDLWCSTVGQWSVRVRTKGLHADWGAWSDPRTFTIAQSPSLIITSPSGEIDSSPFTVSWSVQDDTGVSSQTVSILVDDVEVFSQQVDPSLRDLTIGSGQYLPDNGEQLLIRVHVVGGSTLDATEQILVNVNYTPPADPYMSFEQANDCKAIVAVAFGTPSYGQPETEYVSVYQIVNSRRILIADRLGDKQQAVDVLPPLNWEYEYEVVAHAPSGATSSFRKTVTYESHYSCINFGTDAGVAIVLGENAKTTRKLEHATTEYHFARGDTFPVSYRLKRLDSTIYEEGSMDWNQWLYFHMLDQFGANVYGWFREGSGRRAYGKITGTVSVDTTEDKRITYQIDMVELDWKDPVR